MFGVLRGASCALDPGERLEWTGHVCGVCQALKERYGPAARLATNYDAALLSALCEAQAPQPQARRASYCPFRTSFKAEIVAAGSPGAEYGASMALMMASARIQDRLQDRQGGWKAARGIASRVANRWMRAAGETAAALGLDARPIEEQVRRQAAVEARPGRDFSFYARPTELAVGTALGYTAVIANRPQNIDILHEMGQALGRIMLVLDSYQDYAADLKARSFNALAAALTAGDRQRQAATIFAQAHGALRRCFYRLDLARPALAEALLVRQLGKRGQRTLQICGAGPADCRLSRAGPALAAELPDGGLPGAEKKQAGQGSSCFLAGYPCDCSGCDCSGCDCCDGDCSGCDCKDCNCCEGNCCDGNCDCCGGDCSGCDCNC